MKKSVVLALALISASAAQAQPYGMPAPGYGAPAPQAAQRFPADGPAAMTQRGMEQLLEYLQNSDGDLKELGAFLNTRVAPYFDFAYMAKAAAGNLYRHMSEEQRARLAARIKRQFLSAMVEKLGNYSSQQVKVVSQRLSPDGRTGVVSTAIRDPRGYPARMDFRFYKSKDGWKVYDVMANGQSAVVHYRRQFRQAMYRPVTRDGRGLAARPDYPQATARR